MEHIARKAPKNVRAFLKNKPLALSHDGGLVGPRIHRYRLVDLTFREIGNVDMRPELLLQVVEVVPRELNGDKLRCFLDIPRNGRGPLGL